ncbi:hypothetical protein HN670_01060 [bacterium]|jgi:hypothetical protein|nr:hypothetical protein [bacterium]
MSHTSAVDQMQSGHCLDEGSQEQLRDLAGRNASVVDKDGNMGFCIEFKPVTQHMVVRMPDEPAWPLPISGLRVP